MRICGAGLWCLLVAASVSAQPTRLDIRVDDHGWGSSSVSDMKAVLHSTAAPLIAPFGDLKLDPIEVARSETGPIVLFQRGSGGEYRVRLDTQDRRWAQLAFQFAHELCHILCGYVDDRNPNQWFEETLCETASLYALRRMAETWKTDPPYANWKDYAQVLGDYAQDRFEKYGLKPEQDLPAWYRGHEKALREKATLRDKNTAVAIRLLPIFEEDPARWRAVAYLNKVRARGDQPFDRYLGNWRRAAPAKWKPVVDAVARRLGVEPR